MNRSLCILGTLFAASAGLPARGFSQALPKKLELPGFLQGVWDTGRCYVSGQPSEEALRSLKDQGFKTVICLRGTQEMNDRAVVPFDEAAVLKGLGVNYVHIPVGEPSEYSPASIEKFIKTFDHAHGKILVHCTVGWRASYVWASYLYKAKKMPLDQAIRHGMAMNMTPNRVTALLGATPAYGLSNHTETSRTPKYAKPEVGTAPVAINPADPRNFMAFVAWDLGKVINASQPTESDLNAMKSRGVTRVVNIRTEAEMEALKKQGFDEESACKALGLDYVNIPIQSPESFNQLSLAKVIEAIKTSKGRVLLHCLTATRTSSVWAAYLVKAGGMSLDEAMKHAEAMRFSNPLGLFLGQDIVYLTKAKPEGEGC